MESRADNKLQARPYYFWEDTLNSYVQMPCFGSGTGSRMDPVLVLFGFLESGKMNHKKVKIYSLYHSKTKRNEIKAI
jgi:hypothetical protein